MPASAAVPVASQVGAENCSPCYPDAMPSTSRDDALRALADLAKQPGLDQFELDEAFQRGIRHLMDLPQNQNGADKSHVWAIYERCRAHFRVARPV